MLIYQIYQLSDTSSTKGDNIKILNREDIKMTGFAGIKERRIVTDTRLFGSRKKPDAAEGYGQFIYLADALYEPCGESGMHSHEEVDIITVILDGQVSHQGSLEHGKNLKSGEIQVQRAGGEGFSHNEQNPDQKTNRILQIWALPEKSGLPAGYKSYKPKKGLTKIYGGSTNQNLTFSSSTSIEYLILDKGKTFTLEKEALTYLAQGSAVTTNQEKIELGDLSLLSTTTITANEDLKMILIKK